MGEDKEVDSHSCLNYWSGLSTNIVSGTHQESLEQNAHKIIDAIAHKKPASSDDSVLSRSSAEIPLIYERCWFGRVAVCGPPILHVIMGLSLDPSEIDTADSFPHESNAFLSCLLPSSLLIPTSRIFTTR